MKKVLYWLVYALLCIWQFPQFIVAILMLPFMGKLNLVANRHYNLCFEGSKMRGGISLGPISYVQKGSSLMTIAHEVDGHTKDSKIFGPLYLFVIGIPSIMWAWKYDHKKHCYYDFYTERRANEFAGRQTTKTCKLSFGPKK